MGQPKNKKESGTTRRQFIGQAAVGSTALVGLTSCELSDLNFIGKLKGSASGKPSEKEIASFLQAIELEENVKKVVDRMKKNLKMLNPVPPEVAELFSDTEVAKLISDEVAFYTNFYQSNYTAGEVRDLTRIINSKLWQKYTHDLQTAGNEPGSTQRPSTKFATLVTEKMKSAMDEKMKHRAQPKS